ncbi:transglycosylase SLT domain-containing protein [Salinimonas iocasae]|uniref:Lytic murein transglycosylase n=1 Tax=Salinimonas iocasae TaxID=2572577 RepID=A0A5B7YGF2_9ALTE|nr:transglycosylase SLT domain-containing protein [Salinimonas iocasae]QCZ94664.1 lytic murein transglycosylase [Salinimonas iocasae]
MQLSKLFSFSFLQNRRPGHWSLSFILLCLSSSSASATSILPDAGQSAKREQYEFFEEKLRTVSYASLDGLKQQYAHLKGYPLYPYLERQRLYRQMDLVHRDEIEQFLSRYDGRPASYGMRSSWLRYLAEKGARSAFLANYRDGLGATITCQYLQYQLKDARNPRYWLSKVEPIWLNGQSQPDECDPVFRQWQRAGMMTEEMVMGRIEKAATSGNPRLVPYLKRKLPASVQHLADRWLAVRNNPAHILSFSRYSFSHPDYEQPMVVYGLKRLAWQDSDKAVKAYNHYSQKKLFSDDELMAIHRVIALSKAIDNKPDAGEWLRLADVKGAEEDVKRWHLSYLLRQRKWGDVLALINTAPQSMRRNDNFMYWQARALEAQGYHEQADELYNDLAGQRHYYGFLASAKVGQKPALLHKPAPHDAKAIQTVATLPSAQRAYEFLQMGRQLEARREWYYLLTHIDTANVKDAALLASEWGWYDQSIISFSRSGYLNDIEKRFPLAYANEFTSVGETYNVQPAFAMAIARRESSFRADAVSPAGAAGLMQLMPGTARYLAQRNADARRQSNIPTLNRTALFEPANNLQYGVQYLRYLGDKLGDNPVLISASYNAGWRKVLEWLPETTAMETDIWIENIPYKETRHYVKAVMAYRYIYEYQLGAPSALFQQLAESAIPSAERMDSRRQAMQLAPD